jgi:hypothetical protein
MADDPSELRYAEPSTPRERRWWERSRSEIVITLAIVAACAVFLVAFLLAIVAVLHVFRQG